MTEPAKTRYTADQVRAMAFPLHRIEWTIRDDGGPQARLSCDAPEGSKCRLECAEQCGSESWPCRSWDPATDDWSPVYHDLTDSGWCGVLAYWDDGTAAEVYDQDAGEAQVRSGPISVRWNGDNYLWRYADEDEALAREAEMSHTILREGR
jgi:hypothetical protein